MTIEALKTKINYAKKLPAWQARAAAEAALDCAVTVIEAQDKRITALEKQLKGVCHG
jgi:hypothetical protein